MSSRAMKVSIAAVLATGSFLAASPVHAAPTSPGNPASQRPVYAIAHRVLTVKGVDDAVKLGANAIEIDLTARKSGWSANHDGLPTSAGDSAETMFKHIAAKKKAGSNISFIWLDIKNPDYCKSGEAGSKCSIDHLRDLARNTFEKEGVRALYGFYKTAGASAWNTITHDLNDKEAVALSGPTETVLSDYNKSKKPVPVNKRVADYGFFDLRLGFGSCTGTAKKTCDQLRLSSEARDKGKLGKVFGWTVTGKQKDIVSDLLGKAHVDGLIAGFKATHFYEHPDSKASLKNIQDWVAAHPQTHRMATANDKPW
ncbi:Phospholipase D precursor [Dermatophilus congolensis]|uniref:Phospholipase D n=1 Tax=Dermatophilus congolensis TaxID=1863 RepID=A0AA46BPR5_9MICO|nr:phospholipase [Dermatophilus congolensis]STD13522.1 Phospholipase D precursor [Dermatophilus congolensis]